MKTVTNRDGVKVKPELIEAVHFQAVTFYDEGQKRQVIVLYSLGADGIIREFIGGKWNPYPINP
jgi:hypothetical protein